jgi:hypothetical protein
MPSTQAQAGPSTSTRSKKRGRDDEYVVESFVDIYEDDDSGIQVMVKYEGHDEPAPQPLSHMLSECSEHSSKLLGDMLKRTGR